MASSPDQIEAAAAAPPARWWHTAPDTGRIVCDLCPRECHLKPGDRGFCFVRENRDGEMVLSTYGRSTGFCIDPIEKKPLNHFFPGTSVLSFGTAGCNLGCKFCQNWDISKSREIERLSQAATPEAIARAARELGCRSVAFTYNDPVVWAEYAIDTARACRAAGIKTVAVTAGYITPEARGPFYEFMDAANVDLKAFTEDFYWHLTQSHLEPVLDTLRWLKTETDVWFEITNLVIPRANDSPDEFQRMCAWVLEALGDEVPVHFTAFHPDFRLLDRPPTPPETLIAAYDIARRTGLKYVYVGNVHDRARQSTFCPGCGLLLVDRNWHELRAYRLRDNFCCGCGAMIPGRFDREPGNWGQRRLPVDMARFAVSPVVAAAGSALPIVERPDAPGCGTERAVDRGGDTPRSLGFVSASNPQMNAMSAPGTESNVSTTSATLPTPQGLEELSEPQRQAIHRAASRFVACRVLGIPCDPAAVDFAGAGELNVTGAYVTLRRGGHLRACCGQVGSFFLSEVLKLAADKTAIEDPRLPPVSACELAHLELEVTLLHRLRPVPGRGAERVSGIVPGRHGLVLRRGQASALFLPQVAREHNWDRDTLLRELCVKGGLPTTAWKQDDCHLFSFEGLSIPGRLDGDEIPAFERPPRFSRQDAALLREHCRNNLVAVLRGAVACYFLPGGPDGPVNGLLLSLHDGRGAQVLALPQIDLLKSVPLQSTAFQLVEQAADILRRSGLDAAQASQLQVSLTVLCDAAFHGSTEAADLGGIDPRRRLVFVRQNTHAGWAYEPAAEPGKLLEDAAGAARVAPGGGALVFSLEVATEADRLLGGSHPRVLAGGPVREPAVAGAFYPADPGELARTVDALFGPAPAPAEMCSAVLVPHAGLTYSGRLAAATLRSARIPQTVIVIGPKHTPLGARWAVAPHQTWQFPGGSLESDPGLARRLSEAIPGLELDAAAHQREHAIEVELPLIARLAPRARVVGIVMCAATLTECRRFAAGLAEVLRNLAEPPLLVISSDMNHFASDAETRELDALAVAALETLDPGRLFDAVRAHHISMCGVLPAVVVMEALRELGRLRSCRRIGYATSADASGDTSRVVGYAGLIFGS